MKSPLVEALRQAGDGRSEDERPGADVREISADEPADAEATAPLPESDELQLMESTDALPVDRGGILPIDGDGILPIDGDGIPSTGGGLVAADSAEAQPSSADDDAGFHETASLTIADDEALPAIADDAMSAAPAATRPVSFRGPASGISRLGLYSPLLCTLLAATAAGSYFVYQGLAGWYENKDLATLSSQVGTPVGADQADSLAAETLRSPFELVVGSRTTAQTGRPADAAVENITDSAPIRPRAVQRNAGSKTGDVAFAALNLAYESYERGDHTAAEAAYRRALQLAPRHPNGLHGLAAILQRSGRIEESLQYYEMLLSVEPNNSAAAVALLAGRGESPQVATESEIKHLIQRYPDSAHLQFALGSLFARQSRWAEARFAFDTALRLDAGNADYLFNLAVSLEHLGQLVDARHYYRSALAAANATSTLDSGIAVARIEELALLSNPENPAQ